MKVQCWSLGRTDEAYLKEGMNDYIRRLGLYLTFSYLEIQPAKSKKAASPEQHRQAEKEEILKLLKPNDFLVLLDEKGKSFTSTGFAAFLQKKFNEVGGSLIFLIGGAYGFHEDIYARANSQLALSEMTFTHQMVRLIFLEQLYRAMTILKGEPYHH